MFGPQPHYPASGWDDWGLGSVTSALESAVAYVQDDLQEFVGTVTGDTNAVASETVTGFVSAAEEGGAASVLDQVSSVAKNIATSLKEDTATTAAKKASSRPRGRKGGVMLGETREEAKVRELRHDPATYLTKPKDEVYFSKWSKTFELNDQVTEVSSLLSTDSELRKLHAQLVPRKISYNQFWVRYFYALHLVKEKEQKRKALLTRFLPQDDEDADGGDGWGDDGWGDDKDKSPPPSTATTRVKTPPVLPTPAVITSAPPKPPLERDLKKLRARIKAFDDEFTAEHGRKPTAKDRRPIQDVVLLFKEMKAEASESKPDRTPSQEAPAVAAAAAAEAAAEADTEAESPDLSTSAVVEPPATSASVEPASEPAQAVRTPTPDAPATAPEPFDQPETPTASAAAEPEVTPEEEPGSADLDTTAMDPTAAADGWDDTENTAEEDDEEISFKAQGPDAAATPAATSPVAGAGDAIPTPVQVVEDRDAEVEEDEEEPGESPLSDDSNLGVNSISSSDDGGQNEPGSSSSSFEVLEPSSDIPSDLVNPGAAAAAAADGDDDDWGDW